MPDYEKSVESAPGADDESMALQAYNPLGGYTTEPEFEQGDAYVPRLRLAQGLTSEVQDGLAKPGEWLLIGHEPVGEMVIVPVAFATKRELRDDESRDILCFSQDGKIGQGNPGGVCAECPLSQWQKGPDGSNIPPACDRYFSYIVFSATHNAMCILELRKSAIKPGRVLNTMVKNAGLGNFAVKLGSKKKQGPQGTYALPDFSPLPAEELEAILETAQQRFEEL